MVIEDKYTKNKIDTNKLDIYVNDEFKLSQQESRPMHKIAKPMDRFGAFLIDTFSVLMPLTTLLTATTKKDLVKSQLINQSGADHVLFFSMLAISLFSVIFYQTIMTWKFGATIGKLFFGLRVVNIWTHKAPSLYQAFMRSCFWCLESLLFFIPNLSILSHQKRRPFHDRAVETVVVSIKAIRSSTPNPLEQAIAHAGYASLVVTMGLFSLGFMMRFSDELQKYQSEEEVYGYNQETYSLCDDVDKEMKVWNFQKKDQERVKRLNVSMSLYAAGIIGEECLEKEVDYAIEKDKDKGLAYLAKSFVYKDVVEVSNEYLNRVCKDEPNSRACLLSQAILAWDSEHWQKVYAEINDNDLTHDFLNIWSIQYSYKSGDFKAAKDLIQKTHLRGDLSQYLNSVRTKVYYGLDQTKESEVAQEFVFDSVAESRKVDLAGWICFHELQNSCDKSNGRSCEIFYKAAKEDKEYLEDEKLGLAYVRYNECQDEKGLASLQRDIHVAGARLLVEAIVAGKKGEVDRQNFLLLYLAKDKKLNSSVRLEALSRLFKKMDAPKLKEELPQLVDLWMGYEPSLQWKIIGQNIFDNLLDRHMNEYSLMVGTKLRDYQNKFLYPNPSLDQNLAKAAYR
ncbi:MAG: RDD family protein, partial [Bdellovibrionales bacterium]|nr:RDD family protein [Bdellovibrionales bacterium]